MSEHRLTRAKLLRHAAAGAAATAASGTGAGALGRLLDVAAAADLTPAAAGAIHHFRSRPDLKPPVVRVLQRTDSVANGYVLLAPSSGPGQRGPMIIDDAGNVVWFHRTKKFVVNLRAALYRGRPVLTWWEGEIGQGLGLGEHVIVDSSYRELARFPAGRHRGGDLHELVLTPSGTALVTAWSAVTRNLLSLGGKRRHRVVDGIAQEIEIPSARVLFEWRSINHVPLSESHVGVGPQFDYFHINSIDVAPDGDLIVSARNTWTIYKISRKTGKIVWRLGGKKSDFALSRNARFAWQHDARVHGDGDGDGSTLSLFDDGAAPAVERESRGLVFQLDGARKRATLLRMYRHRPHKLLAYYMGSMQLLPNGNAMLGWGSAPYITEFGEDGSIVFDATLPRGGQTYRAVRMPWSGRPATPPALAASNGRLYASWNGSTELAAWHVRSGSSPTTLQDAATVPASGFETAITLTGSPAYAAVTALDAVGTPLSTSKTVRV